MIKYNYYICYYWYYENNIKIKNKNIAKVWQNRKNFLLLKLSGGL